MKTEHAIDWCKTAAEIQNDYESKCLEITRLREENERLVREVVNRNQRALDGDKSVKAMDALIEENERLKAELEKVVADYTDIQKADHEQFVALSREIMELKAQSSEPVAIYDGKEGEYGYEVITSYEDIKVGALLYTAAPRDEQVETLRRDAERYRILRESIDWVVAKKTCGTEFSDEYLDNALDAARKGEE